MCRPLGSVHATRARKTGTVHRATSASSIDVMDNPVPLTAVDNPDSPGLSPLLHGNSDASSEKEVMEISMGKQRLLIEKFR